MPGDFYPNLLERLDRMAEVAATIHPSFIAETAAEAARAIRNLEEGIKSRSRILEHEREMARHQARTIGKLETAVDTLERQLERLKCRIHPTTQP